MVWAKRTGNSPVVAMDGSDGPAAYGNPAFRKLLGERDPLGRLAGGEGLGR